MLTATKEMGAQPATASDQPSSPAAGSARMVGLDGVRALAVIAVVIYHFNPSWLPGGFFGVDVFFVISGFLITGLVAREWERTGHIDVVSFWWRRARRLLPAVIALLAVVILVSAVGAPDALARLRTDVPAALFYITNWWFIFHKVSYFQAAGRPSLVLHLWSLAIEEQFYVLWPLALTLLLPRIKRLRLAAGTAAAALASTVLMAVLFHPNGADPSRVYFGTDTHAQGLLLGCTLALVLPHARLALLRSRHWQIGFNVLGGAGLAALGWLVFRLNDYGSVTYRGGFALVDLAAVALVIAAASPVTIWAGALARQPLRWVGTRSYAIYLWHWPIQQLMRAHTDVPFGGPALFAVQTVFILAAAELSYRFVETPIRTGRARAWLAERYGRTRWREAWIIGPGVFLVVLTMITMNAPAPKPSGLLAQGSTAASRVKLTSKSSGPRPPTTAPLPPPRPTGPPLPLGYYEPVLAIGDSVMLGCSGALQSRFGPQVTVDAAVDRHVDQGISRLEAYKQSARLLTYKTLIIGLGTNGPMTAAMFQQIMTLAVGIPNILFISTYDDRSWESSTNTVLTQGVATHPGAKLVDWYSLANSNPSLLGPDGVHPRLAGIEAYANLLLTTLDPPTALVPRRPAD